MHNKLIAPNKPVTLTRAWQVDPKEIREDGQGYLLLRGVIAREGMALFRADELFETLPDGFKASDVLPVYTEADAIYQSAYTYELKPLTNNHPPFSALPLTAANRSEYEQGVIGGVEHEGGALWATIRVWGDDAKAALMGGEAVELSTGVTSTVSLREDGRLYETDIMGDHVAIVKRGRCGAECSVKYSINSDPQPEVHTVKVDLSNGTTVELGEAEAQLVQAAISFHVNAASEAQGRVAGLEGQVTTLKANQATNDLVHKLAVERATLLRRLPEAEQDCQCSNADLKRKIATNAGLTVADNASEAYLDGMLAVLPATQNSNVADALFKANSQPATHQTYEEQMAAKAKFKGAK